MTTDVGAGTIPHFTMGDRLRKARELTGLGTAEFADVLGVSRNTIGNYEADRVQPRRIVLRAWSLRTGVPVAWLETGESPRQDGPDGGSAALVRPPGLEPGTRWFGSSPVLVAA